MIKINKIPYNYNYLVTADYKVKLGSIISPEFREYYSKSKFDFLEQVLEKQLSRILQVILQNWFSPLNLVNYIMRFYLKIIILIEKSFLPK